MSDTVNIPDLERIVFFNGQRLTAEDLTAEQVTACQMRWLHNRLLHQPGIVTGFAVSGQRGDRVVMVELGLGYDAFGREVVLTNSLVKGIPVVEGHGKEVMFYLVAMYQEDAQQKVVEQRDGVCTAGGAVRLSNNPRIEWRAAAQVKEGIELILATVWIENCKLSRAVSGAARRFARPSQQPYLSSGQTNAETTAWQSWPVGQGFTTQVDTSSARFQATPHYMAHIVGERYLATVPGPLLAVAFASVAYARSDRFTLQVMLPAGESGSLINPPALRDPQHGPGILQTLGWHVVWMGMEG